MSKRVESAGLPLSDDYPAAHSMDTTWYAVDLDGHVAVFETGENGHAPIERFEGYFLDSLAAAVRGDTPVDGESEFRDNEELASEIGCFTYDYSEGYDPIEAYTRMLVPENPLHVDQLPPDLRKGFKQVRFPIRFREMKWLQPIEHFPCEFWYDERVCYVLSDGKTVRPFPGKESGFAEAIRQFREDDPVGAARYTYEGIDHGN